MHAIVEKSKESGNTIDFDESLSLSKLLQDKSFYQILYNCWFFCEYSVKIEMYPIEIS